MLKRMWSMKRDSRYNPLYWLLVYMALPLPLCQALLELWNAGVLRKFDEEKLLVKAESAKL